jgi:hypothetical protein
MLWKHHVAVLACEERGTYQRLVSVLIRSVRLLQLNFLTAIRRM